MEAVEEKKPEPVVDELFETSKEFFLDNCVACKRPITAKDQNGHKGLCTPCHKFIMGTNE